MVICLIELSVDYEYEKILVQKYISCIESQNLLELAVSSVIPSYTRSVWSISPSL